MRHKFNFQNLHHVLDDFLIVSHPLQLAGKQLGIFLAMCGYLGIPVVTEKTESGTVLIFLGVEFHTNKMEARLPIDKVEKSTMKIQSILGKSSIT